MAELRVAAAARQPDGHRMPGLGIVEPDSGRGQPGIGQRAEGLPQPSLPEVQHMIVGQSADVRPGYGHARQVVRAHPVVHGLARGEVGAAGNADLQGDDPTAGAASSSTGGASPHGQEKLAGRGIGPLARSASLTLAFASSA